MKAIRIHERGGPEVLRYEEAPVPEPGDGEILIRVHAAGITPGELDWFPTWFTHISLPRAFPITPGHEFSGEVVGLGSGVEGVAAGDRIFGLNDWFSEGALAEYCLTRPEFVAPMPDSLDARVAAATPIAALSAWQGLMKWGRLSRGKRVLIHGGAGGVGHLAVQIAKWRGAHVIATCASRNEAFVREMGAHETIDYELSSFDKDLAEIDLVFDTVGGETLERSPRVLGPNGRLVTITNDGMYSKDPRVKSAFFIVEPDRMQLEDVADWIGEGILKPVVDRELPLARAREAFEAPPARGKTVVLVRESAA
jgi:NADPH:quinone reductase-like Zn-dependent oxidoreductase